MLEWERRGKNTELKKLESPLAPGGLQSATEKESGEIHRRQCSFAFYSWVALLRASIWTFWNSWWSLKYQFVSVLYLQGPTFLFFNLQLKLVRLLHADGVGDLEVGIAGMLWRAVSCVVTCCLSLLALSVVVIIVQVGRWGGCWVRGGEGSVLAVLKFVFFLFFIGPFKAVPSPMLFGPNFFQFCHFWETPIPQA